MDAKEQLGEDVLVQAVVQTVGTGKSMTGAGVGMGVGGLIGAAAAGALSGRGQHGELLGFKGRMFMLVGPTKVGFFKFKQGLLRASVGEPLGILRRDAITSIAMGGGMLTTAFTVNLDDGTALPLEAPRAEKGKVEKVAAMIGTRPAAPPPPPAAPPAEPVA